MYIRKTGYVVGPQVVPDLNTERTKLKDGSHKVMKIGCVLTRQEEKFGLLHKGVDIAAIANRGLDYYQVNSSQGACERCMIHNGAIYPVVEAKEGDNLPPFHPNCLCSIVGIGTVNPHDDPWLAETICWLDIMYGDGTFELKAQKLIDFYSWSEFSVDYIADILSSIDDISHIGRRIDTFFTRLNETSQSGNGLPSNVSDTGLVLLKLLEGFSGGAYSGVDSQNQTIGYGHVVRLGENFSNGLTEAQATELLKQDLKKFQTMLGHFVKANNLNLSQNQYDALLLFSYQQGEYVWGGMIMILSSF